MLEAQELAKNRALQQWRVEDSIELYGIRNWGAGFFTVSDEGDVVVCPQGPKGPQISIPEIISGLRERGYDMPVLLRVENILDSRIASLHESFRKAIKNLNYQGEYRGVFPIKVNQWWKRSPSSVPATITVWKWAPRRSSSPPSP